MKKSFEFIKKSMKVGGFLQFGLDGQLKDLYSVINETIKKQNPEILNSIKFPLFYPTIDELEYVVRENGLKIFDNVMIKEDLVENSVVDVLEFVKGFVDNYIRKVMDESEICIFYDMLEENISKNFTEIVKCQWNHIILRLGHA